ncbi:methyltransferase family protein [Sphingomonas oligoaromativorans]|uniref:methyltransferase family protein n=1 Tax=Sphingomonas oligoaromativorans TaxID=575322 RepID=UPI0014240113|nr:isoprenylcysteine carboxylmethyltransferase family protein [Sphingomonas oligoaromativorans]NIJ34888.1 protein-S-isoprenylcysteine O-methyltransferase Ste14 [Sphingomonas oligoaromativorans]
MQHEQQQSDARPRSAVSTGVGLVGLAGLAAFYGAVRLWALDSPWVPLAGLAACALPMLLWSLLVDRVHRNPSTGIDWSAPPRPWQDAADTGLVKLAGLWATWGLIAGFYALGRWYWSGDYLYAMDVLRMALLPLLLLSIPYVIWLDRRLVEPRDGAWAFGTWLLTAGRGADAALRRKIAEHMRSWAIKGFFTAFMLSALRGNWAAATGVSPAAMAADPVALADGLVALMFLIDVSMGTVGYLFTMRPLDSHIRSGNPFVAGWTAALICYPPFILMNAGGPLDYQQHQLGWARALSDHPLLQPLWAFALVGLTAAYAWATVAFGLRFSNLTHRGILTHGPYRFTKHPAYVSKNLFWWMATLPMLTTSGDWRDGLRNSCLLAVISGVYFWRAKTEERHLMPDPAYRAYAGWMARHGPLAKAWAAVRPAHPKTVQPAE